MKGHIAIFFILISFHVMGQDNQMTTDWANLKKYAAENRKLQSTIKGKRPIVFMGDSISEFWKSMDSSFFTANSYIDRGISGQTTSQMLVRFQQDVIDLDPAIVVILAGINDIAENTGPITIEHIFNNIVSMAQLSKKNKIKVILSSVLPAYDFPWHPGLQPAEKITRLNTMIRSYCATNNIVYVDYHSKMADERKGLDKRLSEDGVHPTVPGYKIMEPLVQDAIKKVLKQQK